MSDWGKALDLGGAALKVATTSEYNCMVDEATSWAFTVSAASAVALDVAIKDSSISKGKNTAELFATLAGKCKISAARKDAFRRAVYQWWGNKAMVDKLDPTKKKKKKKKPPGGGGGGSSNQGGGNTYVTHEAAEIPWLYIGLGAVALVLLMRKGGG